MDRRPAGSAAQADLALADLALADLALADLALADLALADPVRQADRPGPPAQPGQAALTLSSVRSCHHRVDEGDRHLR